jgi:hypothetical protein
MGKDAQDWRLINLPDRSGSPLNFLKTRKKIKELDAVAAAVGRCEAILEATRPPDVLQASGAEYDPEDASLEAPARSGQGEAASRDWLLALIRQEKALRKYLDAAEDNDPVRAFAFAKGDVAYLDRLRSSDFLNFTPKASFGKALLPIAVVLLTALSANVVGIILQSMSLKNNRTFEVNLERLREGQRLAGNLYVSVVDFQQRTASDESKGPLGRRPVGALNEFHKQLEQIRNMVAGKRNDKIDAALKDSNGQVNNAIGCFNRQAENPKASTSLCAEHLSPQPFSELQDAISGALVDYLGP